MLSDVRTDREAYRLLPYLNGIPVQHCVAADDEAGWVEVYTDLEEIRPGVVRRLTTNTRKVYGSVVMLDKKDPRAAGWYKGEPLAEK